MVTEAQRTTTATNIIDQRLHDNNNLLLVGSHLTDSIGCNVNYGWPSSLAFHQQSAGHPFHQYPNYPTQQQQQQQRVIWCKQEQDNSDDHHHHHHHHGSFQDTHNFLQQQQQPSVLHNLMSLDSSSLDHNSGSNSVIYSINGYGNNIGGGGGFLHLPIGNQNENQDQDQNQNGFLDHHHHHDQDQEVKEHQQVIGYGNLYYYQQQQQQQQQQQLSATMNNNNNNSNNWVASGMATTRSSINVAVCHGPASTFTVWNE